MNKDLLLAVAAALVAGVALAKLPAPTEEQKAKAEEAKVKAAEAAKIDADALTRAQDRVAERFIQMKAKGGSAAPVPVVAAPQTSAAPAAAAAAPTPPAAKQ